MRGGDFHEAVAPGGLRGLGARLHERVIRAGEGDAVDDHQRTRGAGHVDALPQAQRAEEAGVLVLGEFVHQRPDGVLALEEDVEGNQLLELLGGLLRGAAGGKQAQGAPPGGHDELPDFLDGLRREPIAAWLRQVRGGIEDAAAGRVEGIAHVQGVPRALRQAPLGGHGVEAPAQRQGGGGEHHGLLPEQLLVQHPSNGEGSNGQRVGVRALVALQPDHVRVGGGIPRGKHVEDAGDGLHHGGQVISQVLAFGGLLRVARLLALGGAGDSLAAAAQRVRQAHELLLGFLRQVGPAARGEFAQQLGEFRRLLAEALLLAVGAERLDAVGRHLERAAGELGGGYGGDAPVQFVGLIDDHHLVLGQDIDVRHGVDSQQGVIRHHHVDVGSALARLLSKAALAVRAARGSQTLRRGHGYLAPRQVRHAWLQILAVAGFGVLRPLVDTLHVAAEAGNLVLIQQGVFALQLGGLGHLVEADVVGAPLHDGEGGLVLEEGL